MKWSFTIKSHQISKLLNLEDDKNKNKMLLFLMKKSINKRIIKMVK